MRMHSGIIISISIASIVFGMLFRGYQDMAINEARDEGKFSVLVSLSLKQLGEIKVKNGI